MATCPSELAGCGTAKLASHASASNLTAAARRPMTGVLRLETTAAALQELITGARMGDQQNELHDEAIEAALSRLRMTQ